MCSLLHGQSSEQNDVSWTDDQIVPVCCMFWACSDAFPSLPLGRKPAPSPKSTPAGWSKSCRAAQRPWSDWKRPQPQMAISFQSLCKGHWVDWSKLQRSAISGTSRLDGSNENVCMRMIVARNGCWDSHAIVLSALLQVFATQPRPRQVGLDTHTILGYFLELNAQHHTFEAVQVLHSLSLELTELRVLLPARRPVWTFLGAQLTNRFRCIKTLRFRILLCVNFFAVPGVQRSVFCSLFPGIFDVWCNWLP